MMNEPIHHLAVIFPPGFSLFGTARVDIAIKKRPLVSQHVAIEPQPAPGHSVVESGNAFGIFSQALLDIDGVIRRWDDKLVFPYGFRQFVRPAGASERACLKSIVRRLEKNGQRAEISPRRIGGYARQLIVAGGQPKEDLHTKKTSRHFPDHIFQNGRMKIMVTSVHATHIKVYNTNIAAPKTPALSPSFGLRKIVSNRLLKTCFFACSTPSVYNESMFPTPPPRRMTSGSTMLMTTAMALPKK